MDTDGFWLLRTAVQWLGLSTSLFCALYNMISSNEVKQTGRVSHSSYWHLCQALATIKINEWARLIQTILGIQDLFYFFLQKIVLCAYLIILPFVTLVYCTHSTSPFGNSLPLAFITFRNYCLVTLRRLPHCTVLHCTELHYTTMNSFVSK